MKSSDRVILSALVALGLVAGFWMLVMSPKRERLGELDTEVAALRASVAELEAQASAGEAARSEFPSHYRRLVVLGKAVPSAHDEADLIVGLDRIGLDADVSFRSIELDQNAAAGAPAPATSESTTDQAEEAAEGSTSEAGEAVSDPAAATEVAAAQLPLGAAVGPAGLGVMPWTVQFTGDFFDLGRALAAIDRSVRFKKSGSLASGRLVTVDGFTLALANDRKTPRLVADLAIRTYVTPEGEGVTLGATPQGPSTTPVSEVSG